MTAEISITGKSSIGFEDAFDDAIAQAEAKSLDILSARQLAGTRTVFFEDGKRSFYQLAVEIKFEP